MSSRLLPKPSFLFPEVEAFLRCSLSSSKEANSLTDYSERFDHLFEVLSTPPLFTVVRVNSLKSNVHDVCQQLQVILNEDCKWKEGRQCHYKVTAHPSVDDVLLIQGAGPHLDLAPIEKEVIVDLHCGAAVLRGADIFVPGVMAAHPGIDRGDVVSVYCDLESKCRKGLIKPFDGQKVFLGNGMAALARKEIFCSEQNTSGVAIQMRFPLYSCPSLNGVLPHLLFLQNLPSVVVGHVLGPCPGEIILDMCAAPGLSSVLLSGIARKVVKMI